MKKILLVIALLNGCTLHHPSPTKPLLPQQTRTTKDHYNKVVIPQGECSRGTGAVWPDGRYAPVCGVTKDDIEAYRCQKLAQAIMSIKKTDGEIPKEWYPQIEYCKTLN